MPIVICTLGGDRNLWHLPRSHFTDRISIGGGERLLYELAVAVAATGREVELRGDLSEPVLAEMCRSAGVSPKTEMGPRLPESGDLVIVPEGWRDPAAYARIALSPARSVLLILAAPGLFGWPFVEEWSRPDPLVVDPAKLARPEHFHGMAAMGFELWADSPGIVDAARTADVDCALIGSGRPVPYPDLIEKRYDVVWLEENPWAPLARSVADRLPISRCPIPETGREEMLHMLGAGRILIWPSRVEGQALAQIEARAMGTVPVALDTNPFAVGLDEEGGAVLVSSVEEMAPAIERLLSRPDDLAERSERAVRSARAQTDWRTFVAGVDDVLSAMEERNGGHAARSGVGRALRHHYEALTAEKDEHARRATAAQQESARAELLHLQGKDLMKQLAQAREKHLQTRRSLAKTERKLGRLRNRRAVRLALGVAAALERPYRLTKRLLVLARDASRRGSRGRETDRTVSRRSSKKMMATVTAGIRRLRPDAGSSSGSLVSIVVLTRDGKHHMKRLLSGLAERTAYRSFELIVVDNASTDGTDELLRREWPFPIRVIRNEENTTFSEGNNQGIAAANGELVLLLNNDVDPINEGWLGEMVRTLTSSPECGAVGALLVYPSRPRTPSGERRHSDLTVQHRGVGFTWVDGAPRARNLGKGEDPLDPDLASVRRVPAVTGACMLLRRETLRTAGGLTTGYVYGAEDVDLCLKIRAAGYDIRLAGRAALFHHEFGTQDRMESEVKRENRRKNWQLFAERWSPALARSLRLDQIEGAGRWTGRTSKTVGITVTKDDPAAGWGDWFTAHELGDALAKDGWSVVYLEAHLDGWYKTTEEIDLLISLLDRFDVRRAPSGAFTVAWVRNWTDRWVARPWFEDYDLVVASSASSADIIRAGSGHEPVILPLAFNPDRFAPRSPHPDLQYDYVLTGNNWGVGRGVLDWLQVRPDERFALYGRGWEGVEKAVPHWRGFLEYERLPELYSSARIVVDDTAVHTLPYAAMNSRVFEALACGSLVVTNNVAGSEELFDGILPTYSSPEELRAQLDRFLEDEELRRRTVGLLRRILLERHTYELRARALVEHVREAVERPKVTVKNPSSNIHVAEQWGDTHFARAFARSLRKLGFTTQIDLRVDWDDPSKQDADVTVQIRGLHNYRPKPGSLNVLWIISHPDDIGSEECEAFDAVFVASDTFAAELRRSVSVPVSVLHQATDTAQFRHVPPDPDLRSPVLFVGNSRQDFRPAVQWAVELGAPLHVYGARWEQFLPPGIVRQTYFPNERLHELYCSADIVLSDHWPDMARNGFVSNRIFDVLACGAFVVSDAVEGMEDLFGEAVPMFRDKEELGTLLERYRSDPKERARLAALGMEQARKHHSFDARAEDFAGAIGDLLARRPRTIEDMAAAGVRPALAGIEANPGGRDLAVTQAPAADGEGLA